VVTNMKTLISLLAFGLVTFVSAGAILPSSESCGTDEHTEWIAKSLKEIESVKVGMTRVDLLRVFKEEGGISTKTWRRYVYRDCPYIKVDVEFEPVGDPENKVSQSPRDKIIKISRPFLEWSIMD
jgi:hypothetical protein